MEENLSLRERRDRGLNDLAVIVEAVYGSRCTRREPGCICCAGWAIFDMMDQLTDSSHLDLAEQGSGSTAVAVNHTKN